MATGKFNYVTKLEKCSGEESAWVENQYGLDLEGAKLYTNHSGEFYAVKTHNGYLCVGTWTLAWEKSFKGGLHATSLKGVKAAFQALANQKEVLKASNPYF
jgi:hypothetical protein